MRLRLPGGTKGARHGTEDDDGLDRLQRLHAAGRYRSGSAEKCTVLQQ
jgi:hypothetical protein